jgi:divalent metal cation (Fe/Co/Zn/Cd) transporter
MLKLQVVCQNCNKTVELKPETRGNVSYFRQRLTDKDFRIVGIKIESEVTTDLEDIHKIEDTAEIEINSELKEIEIRCKCGEYMYLDF